MNSTRIVIGALIVLVTAASSVFASWNNGAAVTFTSYGPGLDPWGPSAQTALNVYKPGYGSGGVYYNGYSDTVYGGYATRGSSLTYRASPNYEYVSARNSALSGTVSRYRTSGSDQYRYGGYGYVGGTMPATSYHNGYNYGYTTYRSNYAYVPSGFGGYDSYGSSFY